MRNRLPTESDVLIIGGGLAGTATAYYLAREGMEVTLLERLDLNNQASGSNAGSLHLQIPIADYLAQGQTWAREFAPTLALMRASIEVWRGLEAELGTDLEVSLAGGLLVAETETQMRDIETKATIERAAGIDVELISATELRRVAPYLSPRMIGGVFCPHEGKASPLKAVPAFAAAAHRHGARILSKCAVNALALEAGGYRAETAAGTIRARCVVNAAGANAGRVSAMIGIELPIEGHPIQLSVTEPTEPVVPHLVYFAGDRLTLKQARNGSFLIGGGWPARWSSAAERPTVDPMSLRANLRVARHVVPRLDSVRLMRVWPAVVNGTANWRPILGELPERPRFFMNMFPWMGFTGGPIAARLAADLVLGRKPSMEIEAFSPARYLAHAEPRRSDRIASHPD
jgi:glycine/D-amino acid oxidase-like deaminating enzyme